MFVWLVEVGHWVGTTWVVDRAAQWVWIGTEDSGAPGVVLMFPPGFIPPGCEPKFLDGPYTSVPEGGPDDQFAG